MKRQTAPNNGPAAGTETADIDEPVSPSSYSCGVLTVSDKGSQGRRVDTSGELLQKTLQAAGFQLAAYLVVPDDREAIGRVLVDWVDRRRIDLIITTGGTGVDPSDVTPEATRVLLDREVPGICEAMRFASFQKTPHAMLSRGVAGIRKESLIVNLPGSEKAARENLAVLLPALPHGLYKIKGGKGDCGG